MAKSDRVLKRTTNALLDLFSRNEEQEIRISESELARALDVSRTTVHAALSHLENQGTITRNGRCMNLAHPPQTVDYFNHQQTERPQVLIERTLMDRMRQGDWQPGCEFSETDLARLSGVSTASVREFLIGFSRFHMVERRSRGGWKLLGLHVEFANEVAEMRHMIELEAMNRLTKIAVVDDQCRRTAETLLIEHSSLLENVSQKYKDFRSLDKKFHLWVLSHLKNRFATDFFDIVSFVFYYHYKWNSNDELFYNTIALKEHIVILQYLVSHDMATAAHELAAHLTTSRNNLIKSLEPMVSVSANRD
jgi:DNA-binding GntR family transcriptional regulator